MRQSVQDRRNILSQARLVIPVLAVLGSWTSVADETPPGAGDPTQVVDALHEALIEVANRSDSLSYESRFQMLEPAIDNSHDFSTIARLVGGRFWRNLNDKERLLFTEAFRRASIATYVGRFASAEGLNFDQATLHESLGSRVRVRSHLIRADGSRVRFAYTLHDMHDQWRIINILADGVSDLALQRAKLSKLYTDTGLQDVLDHLKAKADKVAEGS